MYMLLHRSDLNISAKLCQIVSHFSAKFSKIVFQKHFASKIVQILMKFPRNFAEYPCIARNGVHSVTKARLQHSFDGHRPRDTSIFLHIFSLQHFKLFAIFRSHVSIFISLFSNRSSSRNLPKFAI